jgi:hypothetical protein
VCKRSLLILLISLSFNLLRPIIHVKRTHDYEPFLREFSSHCIKKTILMLGRYKNGRKMPANRKAKGVKHPSLMIILVVACIIFLGHSFLSLSCYLSCIFITCLIIQKNLNLVANDRFCRYVRAVLPCDIRYIGSDGYRKIKT